MDNTFQNGIITNLLYKISDRAHHGYFSQKCVDILQALTTGSERKVVLEDETPLGTIVAKLSPDITYPGVIVDFKPKNSEYTRPIEMIEYTRDLPDADIESGGVRIVTWGQRGNISDDEHYTSSTTIFAEEDLKANTWTEDEKSMLKNMTKNSDYTIIGPSEDNRVLVRENKSQKCFVVDIKEVSD